MSSLCCLAAIAFALSLSTQAATPELCLGGTHGMALRSDGRVLSWGWDAYGQLGHGRLLFRYDAAPVTALTGIRSVSSRTGGHVLAVSVDGRLFAWGANSHGQAGDGTRVYHGNEVVTALISTVVSASAGGGYSMALTQDGSVWTWGDNARGTLGDGTTVSRPAPAAVPGLSNVLAVSAATNHAMALARDGTVWTWGRNDYGELGNGTTTANPRPAQVPGLAGVVAISAGNGWSLALKSDGTVWAWGANDLGQLGGGTAAYRSSAAPVAGLAGVTAISAGGAHSLALRSDGTVWGWGLNGWGQLGLGAGTAGAAPRAPVAIPGLSGIVAISAGDQQSLAAKGDGSVLGWGYNAWGEIGLDNARFPYRETPTPVPGVSGATEVNAGFQVSFAVSGGAILGWGKNNYQQLASGTATPANQTTPALVTGLDNVASIACGMFASYAVKSDGTLWAWGSNEWAGVGDGTFVSRSAPVRVANVPAVARVSASRTSYASENEPNHVLALDQAGTVWAWGANTSGQLGTGSASSRVTPVALTTLPPVTDIAAGAYHSLARDTQGRVWAWGDNGSGELGDGTTTRRTTPVMLSGIGSVSQVAAGWSFSIAVTADGNAWSWGDAAGGELGTGATANQLAPARIASISTVRSVSAGSSHSLAVLADGSLWAWGYNGYGQVGDGTTGQRDRPIRILPANSSLTAAAGMNSSLAAFAGGAALSWGMNFNGQLGDGTLADRLAPQVVLGASGSGYLNLSPESALQVPADKVAPFPVVASGSATDAAANVSARVAFRSQDQGTSGSVYVFALAPANLVRPATDGAASFVVGKTTSRGGEKADPVACVLAQLGASGELQAVSASSLQAYVTGVLSAQGQAVTVINGIPTANIGGATFYVGYGPNATSMFGNGLNRSVASVPAARECRPQAPQKGWWWNPQEGGRGFSIEASGNNLFMAAYLYDASGRSTWHVASGPTSLDGSVFNGQLMSFANGVTLTGAYRPNTRLADAGSISLAFDDAEHGTVVWPGGAVAIQRFPVNAGGPGTPAIASQPEAGWWWGGAGDSGRGFFIEWQGNRAFLAGYMYDAAGNATWYVADEPVTDAQVFQGTWLSFANGQTLTGPYRAPSPATSVAPVTIRFQGADTALLTLPGGTLPISRFRF